MDVETIIKTMARRQVDRFTKSSVEVRPTLGNGIDLLSYQERVLGPLVLSQSMGLVLFEAGRKVGIYVSEQLSSTVRKLPNYRSLVKSKNLEEARLSTQIALIQLMYQSNGGGLVELTEYEKDKLIVFQVRECAECFGLENMGKTVCYYIAGNLGGVMEVLTGREIGFTESKCTAKGDTCCEFRYDLSRKDDKSMLINEVVGRL